VQQWLDMLRDRYSRDGSQPTVVRSPYPKTTAYSRNSQFVIPMDLIPTTPLNTQKNIPLPHSQDQLQREGVVGRAKRIKLLEDVDIDYYKMIKATMKMEK
jgi:hypothetical protein